MRQGRGLSPALLGAVFVVAAGSTAVLAFRFTGGAPIVWETHADAFRLGTLGLAIATLAHAALTGRLRDALILAAVIFPVATAAEWLGLHTGFPFGATWTYHPALHPVTPEWLAGPLPPVIPLSWFVLAYAPTTFLHGFETRRDGRLRRGRLAAKVLLAALFLVGVDLFLDPIAVATGAWTWHGPGDLAGVPIANFAGWFAIGVLTFGVTFTIAGAGEGEHERGPRAETEAWGRRGEVLIGIAALFLTGLAYRESWLRLDSVWPLVLATAFMAPACVVGARAGR